MPTFFTVYVPAPIAAEAVVIGQATSVAANAVTPAAAAAPARHRARWGLAARVGGG
ncbi:hypothetical protein Q5530_34535 [Saccharothrix sp. BKS2]|uniref:hypothetical protein n=1 Tax=Saccharothrix sp. BKS2 TaxID=3064400 RepID=UPI0039E74BC4